ncbi:MAG: hydrogenase maturation protein [Hyphomicrobiaceae bacterium]|nr:hydrogenase maturation protein [Hyphomicrobiaceae bacterium]
MRVLLLCHSFNSLSQRMHVELRERGHDVSVELDINDAVTEEAVSLFEPDVIVAPFLKRAIPRSVWCATRCLVVHPGPPGDRGPAALDWAILEGAAEWGVTVLEARDDMDAGPVWAWRSFPMRAATKSCIYRNEVTEAAVAAVIEAIGKLEAGRSEQEPVAANPARGWRGSVRQSDRAIDWARDDTVAVLRKIASADGSPGVRDHMLGRNVFLYNASAAGFGNEGARPGTAIARSSTSIARATCDGAIWIGHVRQVGVENAVKRPAAEVLADVCGDLPYRDGPADIVYEESDGVGYLHFPFHNGAMGVSACRRMLAAFKVALERPTRVIILAGGAEFWSNGLDLTEIETASSAADASWDNINAIDDLAEAIVRATSHIIIAAVAGNAGAGGVFLARAADEVWMRAGAILNPHYKDMGNLYGSELWTYLLPRHVGMENAARIVRARLPMGATEAAELGLADRVIEGTYEPFAATVAELAGLLAGDGAIDARIAEKARRRAEDEAEKPVASYRAEELARMRRNFYGFDPSYHIARYNFIHKVAKSRTPVTLARHRDIATRASQTSTKALREVLP